MSKKGSALMQVLVIGLIVAAFAVLMLRYAVTRSANLSRTSRILESQIIADSCLDQYMSWLATSELAGKPQCNLDMNCLYYVSFGNTLGSIPMVSSAGTDIDGTRMIVTSFTIAVNTD